jgi:cell shape-determining protein MreD
LRVIGITVLLAVALALQTSIARFFAPAANLVDLVLVAVVYIALADGPTAGLIAGAAAGLAQDALAATGAAEVAVTAGFAVVRSIIGIGGLAKTVVGFIAGIIGSQFIVARWLPRALVFFTATVAHAIIFEGLYRLLEARHDQAIGAIFSQAGANAFVGVLVFQIADFMPGFVDRRRSVGGMRISRRLD